MRQLMNTAVLLALLLLPSAMFAAPYSDFYVIPVASHVTGFNGTNWMSDVAIQNFSNSVLTVQLFFIESGVGNAENVFPIDGQNGFLQVRPGGNVILKDVLAGYPRIPAIGSILIGADHPFAVTSRSYSQSPSGDTVGQTVLPVADFLDNSAGITDNTVRAYIPGLIQNSRFRTNFGFVAGAAPGSVPMVIEFTLKGDVGQVLGARKFTVQPGTLEHLQMSLGSLSSVTTVDTAGIEVRIAEGNGAVVPYASVIDNSTADAVYVSGLFPPNSAPPGKRSLDGNVFRALFDRMKRN